MHRAGAAKVDRASASATMIVIFLNACTDNISPDKPVFTDIQMRSISVDISIRTVLLANPL